MSPAMLAAQWPWKCYSTTQLPEIHSSVKDVFESVSSESSAHFIVLLSHFSSE